MPLNNQIQEDSQYIIWQRPELLNLSKIVNHEDEEMLTGHRQDDLTK
jgi:hypothetical protein